MPGNSDQCHKNATRCLRLAERARKPEMRETFTTMAEMWRRLAAELEADQALLNTISALELGEPYDALLLTLKLRSWPMRSNERRWVGASNRAF